MIGTSKDNFVTFEDNFVTFKDNFVTFKDNFVTLKSISLLLKTMVLLLKTILLLLKTILLLLKTFPWRNRGKAMARRGDIHSHSLELELFARSKSLQNNVCSFLFKVSTCSFWENKGK